MLYSNKLPVASRQSNLARAQVQEVLHEIRKFYPLVDFDVNYVATVGDKDQMTSLRDLDKTNFFTKEIDEMLLSGICRIAIHSAKDLPEPLPNGLMVACLTKGVDSSDSLVLKQNVYFNDLPDGALIATSSARREESVNRLRKGLTFVDIRGTIEQRLAKLEIGQVDGVVIAEAALIRLGLIHLNRIQLPLPGVKGQGQLAIVAKAEDHEMAEMFACLDVRKRN
jgi:hydroxymethylbilane synthase